VDGSGEYFHQMAAGENSDWIHKDQYFLVACNADIIFVCIDAEAVRDIYNYVAAVHILAQSRKRDESGKVPLTVAIVFTKSDEIRSEGERNEIVQRAEPLLSVCRNTFTSTNHFFVSATGPLVPPPPNEKDCRGMPNPPISPMNVLDPFNWAMSATVSTRILRR
jgi:hypothetical protein